ncbi:MAG: hypothetical protein NT001_07195 [Candidatus Woesearchaeota archaeon]|nr:hypothetical protein [Candidatus Woesearchaeota archaeon]
MTILNYTPIDYTIWNPDGSGSNIKTSLASKEWDIWMRALEYQDKRGDSGHAECVTYFALKLLDYVTAERAIVIPAAILHDTGWSQMTKEELGMFHDALTNPTLENKLRKRHEEQGALFVEKLLNTVYYAAGGDITLIRGIINGHDTREGFLSAEDGVVRDADKLFRFTLIHLNIYGSVPNAPTSKEDLAAHINKPGFFYSDAAKQIARIELEHTFKVHEEMQRRGR